MFPCFVGQCPERLRKTSGSINPSHSCLTKFEADHSKVFQESCQRAGLSKDGLDQNAFITEGHAITKY